MLCTRVFSITLVNIIKPLIHFTICRQLRLLQFITNLSFKQTINVEILFGWLFLKVKNEHTSAGIAKKGCTNKEQIESM